MESSIHVSEEIRRGRNKLAATVVGGHAVKHIYNAALQFILLPVIKVSLSLTGTQLGALSMSMRITSGVTTMGAGYLGDRFANHSGLLLAISLGILGVSFFLLGSVSNFWFLFAVMLLVGIGPSIYHPPAIAALSRKFPDKRGFAISLHGTGGSIGNLIGPVLVGALLAGTFYFVMTWQNVLRFSLIPAVIFAVLIYVLMRNIPAADEGTKSFNDYFSRLFFLVRKRAMIMLVLLTGLRSMGQSAIQTFLPVYLLEDLGYSEIVVPLYLAGAQAAGIVAQPIMGHLSDRYGRKVVLVPAVVALGLLYLGLRFADPGYQLIVIILIMGSFQYSLHSIFIASAMDVAQGESQSTVVSLIYGATFFGAFSPIVAGIITDATFTSNAFVYGGIMVLISALILAVVKLPKTANQLAESGGS